MTDSFVFHILILLLPSLFCTLFMRLRPSFFLEVIKLEELKIHVQEDRNIHPKEGARRFDCCEAAKRKVWLKCYLCSALPGFKPFDHALFDAF